MKKNVILVFIFLVLVSKVNAQAKGDFVLGLSGGYNISTISNSDQTADSGIGFNFAGSVDYYFSKSWSLKGKFIYDQKGWDNHEIYDLGGLALITDVNLNYLTVPVTASWHFGKKKNWFLAFGPYLGFLLNVDQAKYEVDISNRFNSNDFGLALGIGINVPINDKLKILIEMEGQNGFSDIYEDTTFMRNNRNSFNIGMNYLFK